jgi:hypothetical protein
MNKHHVGKTLLILSLLQPLYADSILDMGKSMGESLGKSVGNLFSGTDSNASAAAEKKEVIKRTVAIRFDQSTSPDAIFDKKFVPQFQKLLESGDIKAASRGTASFSRTTMNFQVPAEEKNKMYQQSKEVNAKVEELASQNNASFSNRATVLSENILFGDKSLFYMINPYHGCYNQKNLEKWLDGAGYQVVDESKNPDFIISIKLDLCLTGEEFELFYTDYVNGVISNYTAPSTSNHSTSDAGLIKSGADASLATRGSGNNTGKAMIGAGVALAALDVLAQPQEQDIIRYSVIFEGKNKNKFVFYPTSYSSNSHKRGDAVSIGAYNPALGSMYRTFIAWDQNNNDYIQKLGKFQTEKDIMKGMALDRNATVKPSTQTVKK